MGEEGGGGACNPNEQEKLTAQIPETCFTTDSHTQAFLFLHISLTHTHSPTPNYTYYYILLIERQRSCGDSMNYPHVRANGPYPSESKHKLTQLDSFPE